ncbi:MAG: uS10/mL48 family ribosomal protein, partial [Methanocorpusculum sp.]|nr:uS10/mL48 family ribosomal protein [Methanocorpusculum sp.]
MQKARIRLTGTDYEKVETVCTRIREIAERTGVNMAGPIP